MENTTNTSLRWLQQQTPSIPQRILFGNTLVGAIGFLANCFSVILIFCSENLRQHQRITVLSLTLNDLVFMASLFIFGVLPAAGHDQLVLDICWPLPYITSATYLVSYMTIAYITIITYIAVFRPITFSRFASTRNLLTTVVFIWLTCWIIAFACFRFDLPIQERGCSLILLFPEDGLLVYVIVVFLCACVVILLNIKLLFYFHVRKHLRITDISTHNTTNRPYSPDPFNSSNRSDSDISSPKVEAQDEDIDLSNRQKWNKTLGNCERATSLGRGHIMLADSTGPNNASSSYQLEEVFLNNEFKNTNSAQVVDRTSTRLVAEQTRPPFVYSNVHQLQVPKNLIEAKIFSQGHFKIVQTPSHAGTSAESTKNKILLVENDKVNKKSKKFKGLQLKSTTFSGLSGECSRNLSDHQDGFTAEHQVPRAISDSRVFSEENRKRHSSSTTITRDFGEKNLADTSVRETTKRLHRATITLVLLTLTCCILALPLVLYNLALVVSPRKRVDLVHSYASSFCRMAAGINSLTNPILYTWRLIPWEDVRTFVINKCRLSFNRFFNLKIVHSVLDTILESPYSLDCSSDTKDPRLMLLLSLPLTLQQLLLLPPLLKTVAAVTAVATAHGVTPPQ
ncbi:hypothetical protein PoB_002830100 [Plakobranchus ocellatus]|uniref:G-protein coupled receptors family 1 profile domain-containing protein n=1 Tax=Plakobranchus ocellatus TaxID=259542 RepID=A0AAV3ZRV3_9GAST|nr:hypothetical protein PoB_002830100 [Plakobranchus ocellatus]